MNLHLTVHGLGVAICYFGLLLCLYGLTGARSPDGRPTASGIAGLIVLLVGGVVALAPMIV